MPHTVHVFDRSQKAVAHTVQVFDHRTGLFQIKTKNLKSRHKSNNTQEVSLANLTCECGKFQGTKMPCSHAIAACMHVNVDIWRYVDKCYKLSEALSCYSSSYFKPLANKDC